MQADVRPVEIRRPYAWFLTIVSILWAIPQVLTSWVAYTQVNSQPTLISAVLGLSYAVMMAALAVGLLLLTWGLTRGRGRGLFVAGWVFSALALIAQVAFIGFRVGLVQQKTLFYELEMAEYALQVVMIALVPFILSPKPRVWAGACGIAASGLYLVLVTVLMVLFFRQGSMSAGYIDLYYSSELAWILLIPLSVAAWISARRARIQEDAAQKAAEDVREFVESLPDDAVHAPAVTE